jgi:hypothetical protein
MTLLSRRVIGNACGHAGYDAQGLLGIDAPVNGERVTGGVSHDLAQQVYLGKSFIFALSAMQPLRDNSDGEASRDSDQPYGTFTYRMSEEAWVNQTLRRGEMESDVLG